MTTNSAPFIETITLSHGPLTFSALAAGDGPTVVLLHGFPDTPATFKPQMLALAKAGYRAIAPYLRGYEPGSIPQHNKRYLASDIAQDLISILDQLGEDKVHLVGHDWGSGVAQAAALLAPQRFLSLTIMAVPNTHRFLQQAYRYPRQLKNSLYMAFFQLPGISEWAVKRNDFQFLEYLWRTWSPGWQAPKAMQDELKQVFSQPGVLTATLSYYRQTLSLFSREARRYRALCKQSCRVPTLALTGTQDGCIDSRVFKLCMRSEDYLAGMTCKEIAQAGHFLHLEAPDTVNRALLEWFAQHAVKTQNEAAHSSLA